jgi:hypothetical protein
MHFSNNTATGVKKEAGHQNKFLPGAVCTGCPPLFPVKAR